MAAHVVRTIFAVILVLGGMVFLHEFGHFIVAKIFRIRVDIFSFGFGTRLWGWRRGDTDYRISLFPLGGYVKLAGETTDEELTGAPWEFMSHPRWQQLCVMFAGPLMNFLTALAIPAATAMIHYEQPAYLTRPAVIGIVDPGSSGDKAGLKIGDLITDVDGYQNPTWGDFARRVTLHPDQPMKLTVKRGDQIEHLEYTPASTTEDKTQLGISKGIGPVLSPKAKLYITGVQENSAATSVGLKPGDQFVAINGHALRPDDDGAGELLDTIRGSKGNPVTLGVRRDGQTLSITATPRFEGNRYLIGFTWGLDDGETAVTRLALPAALGYSYHQNLEIVRLTEATIGQVFSGQRPASQVVGGPLRIVQYTDEAAKQGLTTVLWLMGVLSLNLGVFNLFPIPILDGGRIFMISLDAIFGLVGYQLSKAAKERMLQVGFFVIVALMAVVIVKDIRNMLPSKSDAQQIEAPNK